MEMLLCRDDAHGERKEKMLMERGRRLYEWGEEEDDADWERKKMMLMWRKIR
jgi:hypothetical protein